MTQRIPESQYRRVARELAEAHFRVDDGTIQVFLMPDPAEHEVRLLEVSRSAPTTRELFPFAFSADVANGVPLPSVVLIVSPEEWRQVEAGELSLPEGWDRSLLQEVARR